MGRHLGPLSPSQRSRWPKGCNPRVANECRHRRCQQLVSFFRRRSIATDGSYSLAATDRCLVRLPGRSHWPCKIVGTRGRLLGSHGRWLAAYEHLDGLSVSLSSQSSPAACGPGPGTSLPAGLASISGQQIASNWKKVPYLSRKSRLGDFFQESHTDWPLGSHY
jgi:hypothetical protein